MAHALFAIPGNLSTPTGGYAYDRRVLQLLPESGVEVRHVALPSSYPNPSEVDLAETADLLAGAAPGTVLLIDGLAYGALPRGLIVHVARPIVALVHHPLYLETGLDSACREAFRHREGEALSLARHVIVTSAATRRTIVESFGVAPDRITVAEPGTDPAPRAMGTRRPVQMLAVGAVVPRKGYEILVEALAPLAHLEWRLDIAGALDRSVETTRCVSAAIDAAGLANRIAMHGAVSEGGLNELYDRADVYVMPSLYEGYGMALADALACGIAIVSTTACAAGDTVPDAAALKVPPGDNAALTRALARVLDDGALRQRMSDAAWAASERLPRWHETAQRVAHVLKEAAR